MAKVKWKVKFGNLKPSNSQREATEDDLMRGQTILNIKKTQTWRLSPHQQCKTPIHTQGTLWSCPINLQL